jgi:hypothetical protein
MVAWSHGFKARTFRTVARSKSSADKAQFAASRAGLAPLDDAVLVPQHVEPVEDGPVELALIAGEGVPGRIVADRVHEFGDGFPVAERGEQGLDLLAPLAVVE